jgi:Tfp pilus assembly protein PilX
MFKSKKGFGLVMAVMITVVLMIMAAGFFRSPITRQKALNCK